jgi:hypothetical protein
MIPTAVVMGTGPSLTREVIATAVRGQELGAWALYGCNHTWRVVPSLDTFLSCNVEYFESEWELGLKQHRAEKWIAVDDAQPERFAAAMKFGLNVKAGQWGEGFSRDPRFINYGHSSGFQLPQVAVHDGYRRLLLVGYDLKFARDYDGHNHRIGSLPRHFFGEYEDERLQHWPSKRVVNGVHEELVAQFVKVKALNPDVQIIVCSGDSALNEHFPTATLTELLDEWAILSPV